GADSLGVKGAHLGSGRLHALQTLFELDLPQAVIQLVNHVTIDSATRRIVEHDVAFIAYQRVHFSVHSRITGGFVVAGTPRMQGHHAGSGVVATKHVLGNLLRLGR